jgi:undecaprenyl-diphosphatase
MSILQTIALGLIQGLTEFLPVSSSAHLVLLPFFTGWPDPGLGFDVALHWGTLLAVVVYFRADLFALIRDAFRSLGGARGPEYRLPWQIAAATVPGVVAGLLFEEYADQMFRSPALIAVTLSVMGLALAAADRWGTKTIPLRDVSWSKALTIGVCQAFESRRLELVVHQEAARDVSFGRQAQAKDAFSIVSARSAIDAGVSIDDDVASVFAER